MITVEELTERTPRDMAKLLDVWESSVRATHRFLTGDEIDAIKQYVPQALEAVPALFVARLEAGDPVAFMGIDGNKLEMLFVANEHRGCGIGRDLLQLGIEHGVQTLTVNEQNPQAIGFYEHFGFETYKRTELDEEGNPYPLLYMRLMP